MSWNPSDSSGDLSAPLHSGFTRCKSAALPRAIHNLLVKRLCWLVSMPSQGNRIMRTNFVHLLSILLTWQLAAGQTWEGVASKTDGFPAICMSDEDFRARIDTGAIVRRVCEACSNTHKHIYYKRLSPLPDQSAFSTSPAANFLDLFLDNWMSTPENTLNVHFELYSSYQDAISGENRWNYCNYDDPGVGFPRDCGPLGYTPFQWTKFSNPSKDFAIQIEAAPGATDVSAVCEPSFGDGGSAGFWLGVASKTEGQQSLCLTDSQFRAQIEATNGIVRRHCPSCTWSHKYIYYKRISPLPTRADFVGEVASDFLDLFLENWMSSPKNVLNVDFELYSSYQDALDGTNKWTYCNYDDPGVGFPRDCGPWGEVRSQWTAFTRSSRDFVLEVEELQPGSAAGDHICGPPPQICKATGWGDPHIITFDGLRYDAQAHGEVIMIQSLQSDFMVQARFEALNFPATVTTGISIRESDRALPRVQVSLAHDEEAPQTIRGCPVELYVGGLPRDILSGFETEDVRVSVNGFNVKIEYPDAYYTMTVLAHHNKCHFTVDYHLLNDCRPDEDLVGLLGSIDKNQFNDWMDRDGNVIPIPSGVSSFFFQPAYDYVVNNWCIATPQESLFTYEPSKNFFDFAFCGNAYDPSLELALVDAPRELQDLCDGDLGCLVDGVALGPIAAEVYLENEALTRTAAPTISPAPTEAPCTNRRLESSLEERWDISEDIGFAYEANTFQLDFEISEEITQLPQVKQTLFQYSCDELYDGDGLGAALGTFSASNNDGKQRVDVDITLDPNRITSDTAYEEFTVDGKAKASVDFCIRFGVYTPAAAGADEVNFLEVQVTLNADLTDGFDIESLNVAPLKRCEFSVREKFFVEGYFCEEGNEFDDTYDPGTLTQGQMVTICVRPQANARALGIRMRQIDWFYFFREDTSDGVPIDQDAVVDGDAASVGLTELFCSPGYAICHFNTILKAEFFGDISPVFGGSFSGVGQATMQYGSGSDPDQLSVSPRNRRLEGPSQHGSRRLANGDNSFGQRANIDISFSAFSARDRAFRASSATSFRLTATSYTLLLITAGYFLII